MAFLVFVGGGEVFAGCEAAGEDPFGDGGAVHAGGGRDGDGGVGEDRVVREVVDARGEEVDEFEAERGNWLLVREGGRVRKGRLAGG